MSLLRFDPHLTFCDLENKREIEKKIREILIQGHRDPPRGFKKNEMYFQANLITLLVLTGLFDTKIEIYLGSQIIKKLILKALLLELGLFSRSVEPSFTKNAILLSVQAIYRARQWQLTNVT